MVWIGDPVCARKKIQAFAVYTNGRSKRIYGVTRAISYTTIVISGIRGEQIDIT